MPGKDTTAAKTLRWERVWCPGMRGTERKVRAEAIPEISLSGAVRT